MSNSSEHSAVKIFVLDPSSTSLLPNEAFTSENLTYLILKIDNSDLPYILISVNNQKPESSEDKYLLPGYIVMGILVILLLSIVLCCCYLGKCCQKAIEKRYTVHLKYTLSFKKQISKTKLSTAERSRQIPKTITFAV